MEAFRIPGHERAHFVDDPALVRILLGLGIRVSPIDPAGPMSEPVCFVFAFVQQQVHVVDQKAPAIFIGHLPD